MATKKIHVAGIEGYDGESIKLPLKPRPMTNKAAIEILQRAEDEANQPITITDKFKGVFPWDGAYVLQIALKQVFGYAFADAEDCGCEVPRMVSVATSETETTLVPWGRFSLPGMPTARVTTSMDHETKDFVLVGEMKKRDVPGFDKLRAAMRELLKTTSLYRGKVMQFKKGEPTPIDKNPLPIISFLTPTASPPIFSRFIENSVDALILTPIRHRESVKRAGTPIKRGVLLAGAYGTGKTLLAAKIANTARTAGWTVVYVTQPHELVPALNFAKNFQPVVVFIEDIDRVIGSERSDEVNAMINEIDGVGTKDSEIILVMTTNHPETINPAMRRNGRVDVLLHIQAPDAPAVERLIRLYAGLALDQNASIAVPAHRLAGEIPATIREAVERAKLFALNRTFGFNAKITGNDLLQATEMLLAENLLFTPKTSNLTRLELIGKGIGYALGETINAHVKLTSDDTWHSDMLASEGHDKPLATATDHEPTLVEQQRTPTDN